MSVTGGLTLQYPLAGGISLPQGTLVLAASSAVFDFADTTAVALSPVVPAGSVPQWFILYATESLAGEPEVKGFKVGTDADPTYFIDSTEGITDSAGSVTIRSGVSHLFEALAANTTVKVLYLETVGAGSPATAGEWVIALYYLPPAS